MSTTSPPLVDCDWYACKASKEKTGERCMRLFQEMSRAVGVKKPKEAQKANALGKNEGG